jgi:hypothetical protein
VGERLRQLGPIISRPAGVLFKYPFAPCLRERVPLQIKVLIGGADARVSDQHVVASFRGVAQTSATLRKRTQIVNTAFETIEHGL